MATNTPDYVQDRFPGPDPYAPLRDLPTFTLTSTDLENGDELDEKLRAPQSLSPQLSWADLPEGTKSLAITCFDPDAPTGSGYWHWAVFNIPVTVSELPTGAGSSSDLGGIDGVVTLKGDSGDHAHYGANPPGGHAPHRYLYAVHAVDVEQLDIDPEATPTVLGFNLYFHSLARTVLWGYYETKS
ncbi:YbhB/YbcL family Raf kinase inhibitor-like protein [Corynebacterium breve]|uniref:YbhB/YbcL family Raf kinase inhibitor-like protein n=1 Tax=Corynebacterium breve TaxID=3049799 RepID=A0ABY8VIF8_9CORY|nr:YbhB/YbcL family Raf kinase inhibitor-like protein [Corynebacterium breve]WIM68857.1 YbhB/YbcL family Raf kinase inhibitor-like protein [Corynebacterium breve]